MMTTAPTFEPRASGLYQRRFMTDRQRFDLQWQAIPEAGCWIWTGSAHNPGKDGLRMGYGKFWLNGKTIPAHRASWSFHRGEIPVSALVCHKCDVALCVNPAHLFLGTPRDNTMDMVAKGRHHVRYGADNNFTKLTDKQVLAIREDVRPQKVIAREYGICQPSVSLIKRRINWRHLV